MNLKSSLIVLSRRQDSPRSSIQILTAFFASAIFIRESDTILGELGGFHCSSLESIVELNKGGDVEYSSDKCSVAKVVVVLMVKDPENFIRQW